MAGVVNKCPGDEIFTKDIFLTSVMTERFVSTYLLAQESFQNLNFPFIGDMVQSHRKCPYWTLLRQICPCSLDFKRKAIRKRKQASPDVGEVVPLRQVFLFVRRVVLKIIPLSVFGNSKNRNQCLKHVKELLSLPIYGKMSASYMMMNIRTKSMSWLKPYSQKDQRIKLQELVTFLVRSFIGPLVQSFFYVSKNGFSNKLMFYRKKVWHSLVCNAFKRFVSQCKLRRVSPDQVQQERKRGKCLGIASAHFQPKRTTLRPVVNCSKRISGRVSVNDHLRGLHLVLSSEREIQQEKFGASILGMDEFHLKWRQYLTIMRDARVRRYYCIKTDLDKCFDNIDPLLLYEIVKQLMKSSYTVYKYKKIANIDGRNKTIYFETLKTPKVVRKEIAHAVDCVGCYELKKNVLLEKLHALLFCNVIKLGRQYFVQGIGIPQGACISSILCAVYFGHMDKIIFTDLLGHHNFLIRMTDDMLFVTPHKDKAKLFLKLMLNGVPVMKCKANFSKCCINFNYSHPVLGKIRSIYDNEPMRYCGICLNPKTLEISIDFSNYKSIKVSETMSWDLTKNAGVLLRKKIQNCFRPKCFSVLFDKDINSEECIRHNVFCLFAVCTLKFHHLVMKLPSKQRAEKNPAFFTAIIQSIPKQLAFNVSRKLKKISKFCGKDVDFPFSQRTLSTFCNHVFLYKLQYHHGVYAAVIRNLRKSEKRKQPGANICEQLPQIFKSINFKF